MPYQDPEKKRAAKKRYNETHREERLAYQRKYNQTHKEEAKEYREKNTAKISARKKKYNDEHKAEKKEYDKQYNLKNQEKRKQSSKEYREKNKEAIKKMKKEYRNSPGKYDTWFKKLSPYYNSDEIRRDPKNPDLIQFKCYYHECTRGWFNPTNQQLSLRYNAICSVSNDDRNRQCNLYCSDECKNACPAFRKRKDIIEQRSTALSREVQPALRKMVLNRDHYTCQRKECQKSIDNYPDLILHCHHIYPLNEDPIGSADIDNCITVCKECHEWIHKNIPGCTYAELKCSKKQ